MEINKNITPYAICPKCHTKIYYLIETERVYVTFDAVPDKQGNLHYDVAYIDQDLDWDTDYIIYRCPKCDAVLAKNEEEAKALFKIQKAEDAQDEDKI